MRDIGDIEDTTENRNGYKLKEVVEKKHGGTDKKMPTTEIICMHFLEAVEKSKYGWFWQCPAGENCICRHALQTGFALKNDKRDEKKSYISLEDLIEKERAALGASQTKITLETFVAWKKRKIQERKILLSRMKKRNDYKAGRQVGLSSGGMFSFNPELAAESDIEDGDEAVDSYAYAEDEEDKNEYKELQLDLIRLDAQEVDDTGTIAKDDRLKALEYKENYVNGGQASAVLINENVFLDEDLGELDDELEALDLKK